VIPILPVTATPTTNDVLNPIEEIDPLVRRIVTEVLPIPTKGA
jgi:hypothetical protein